MAKTLFDHIKAITTEQNPKYWDTLDESDIKKGRAGVKKYWEDHNTLSLDGFKTL